ncbi:MAG: LLM class flavin-dependent oxidoreductase [Candidatus Binatia bacterium]
MAGRPTLTLALPVHGVPFATTLAAARAAEAGGLDGVWVPDHLLNVERPDAGVLECWTALAAVAAATTRVMVGPLVVTTPFRHPPLLAKQAATLDAIASGRVILGLGAGGFTYDVACAQFGYVPLAPGARVRHVADTIACLRRMWTEDGPLHPRPARAIPIVVAAHRARMMAVVARAADGWNCPLPELLEPGLRALAAHGRARDTIGVSVYTVAVLGPTEEAARAALVRAGRPAQMFGDVERHHVFGAPGRAAAKLAELVRRGADHVVLDVRGLPVPEAVDLLAREVVPLLEA